MENIEIARRLEELADLLEIQGANPFRIRAYRNAIRTVSGLTRPLSEVAAEDALTDLPGIGKDIGGYIGELLDTGKLSILDEVTAEVPRELATLTRLDGVGPKKARKLWKELDVTTPDELEAAAKEGRVAALSGFGQKSVEKILRAIEDFRKHQGRFLRAEAVQYLRPLLVHVEGVEAIRRLEVAGSYRRGKETVGDIDLLALVEGDDDRAGVMEAFTTFPGVDRIEMSGETRGSVVLTSGLPVDLRILGPESYGAALHYFTGSKEHNVEIRKRAQKRGLRVSEYGVFEEEGKGGDDGDANSDPHAGRRIAGATEEEVFGALDLPFIPPVLRENRGEIQAADQGALPKLVEADQLRGDLHMHTTWSDGRDSVRAMAEACRDRGYAYMAITDHSQAVTVARGLTPERLREQWVEIDEARDQVEGIQILRGCEVDILKDGSLDLPDDVLAELDIVLVAVHSHFDLDQATQTERILTALRHPLVDILVHPTGRLINRREPYALDMEAVLQAALEHDVAVELNTNPRRLDLHDRHLFRARELGVPVVISTDAHRTAQLAYVDEGIHQARRGWLEAGDVLNTRDRDGMQAWLKRREG
ncbi:MAG: DNA polymerase/3'-5' exonuclease PolX [Gemmatimonadales bacterium]|nr:MAG: DNA polymerase/3'-5' exonuclease PolX [Gemmatimonadales bacterium]